MIQRSIDQWPGADFLPLTFGNRLPPPFDRHILRFRTRSLPQPITISFVSELPMIDIPVKFPTERERLRRLIDADRGLGARERIQAIDGMLATVNRLCAGVPAEVDHDRLRRIRREEVRSIFREFIQRQLERADGTDGPVD